MIDPPFAEFASALDVTQPRNPAGAVARNAIGARQARRGAAILAAARSLFAEGGSAAVTMRRIAARSGSTVPTIYGIVGNRDAVVERALLEHLETCIAVAPLVADRIGLNVVSGFSETLWLSAQLQPTYIRRQILLARYGLEGRRLGTLFVQHATDTIEGWVRELCGRSRLARRIGHEQIAAAIEAQLRTALLDWAEGNDSASIMRRKLARAPTVCLARFIDEQETGRLANWMATLRDGPMA